MPLGLGIKQRIDVEITILARWATQIQFFPVRIYQDLVNENGFTDSYQSVKRFVRKLREAQPERVWRLECQPGEELRLDFGLGAPIDEAKLRGAVVGSCGWS
jgi:hypothetical protein